MTFCLQLAHPAARATMTVRKEVPANLKTWMTAMSTVRRRVTVETHHQVVLPVGQREVMEVMEVVEVLTEEGPEGEEVVGQEEVKEESPEEVIKEEVIKEEESPEEGEVTMGSLQVRQSHLLPRPPPTRHRQTPIALMASTTTAMVGLIVATRTVGMRLLQSGDVMPRIIMSELNYERSSPSPSPPAPSPASHIPTHCRTRRGSGRACHR